MLSSTNPLTVIAGCGYLGKILAGQLRTAGHCALGLTHSEPSAARLREEGFEARACDLTDEAACRAVAASLRDRRAPLRVIHCAASGRGGGVDQYQAVYLLGARNLRTAFPEASFFLTSSTSVYGQTDGSEVEETTPAEPDRETGRILRQAENETLAAGGLVGRLAGIYGPGRSVLLKHFLQGLSVIDTRAVPPLTPEGRWVNQIHATDAARAILHLLDSAGNDSEQTGVRGIYNISDSRPLTQRELYTRLSRRFQLPLPPEAPPDESRKRGWTHKRVSNSRLLASGWQPRYPDWFAALEHDPDFLPSVLSEPTASQPPSSALAP